jgi:hypothetical protein
VNIAKNKVSFLFWVVILRAILDIAYVTVISPSYIYTGFIIDIDTVKLIESYVLLFILAVQLKINIKKPSDFLTIIFFLLVVVPLLSIYSLRSESRVFLYMMLCGYLITVLIANRMPSAIRIPSFQNGYKIIWIIAFSTTIFILFLMIARGGLQFFNLDLTKVYNYRWDVGKVISGGVMGYINPWVFKILNPTLIAWAIWRRKKTWLVIFLFIQVIFFGISSHKAVLFFPLLIVGTFFVLKLKRPANAIVAFPIVTVAMCMFLFLVFQELVPAAILIHRPFYIPVDLNFFYYKLFSEIGHVYMTNTSILSPFMTYPFSYAPQYLVSFYLIGDPKISSNTGFLATSFMHFGFIGVIVYSMIVGVLLWLVNCLSYRKLPLWMAITNKGN